MLRYILTNYHVNGHWTMENKTFCGYNSSYSSRSVQQRVFNQINIESL